ncbi:MAG: cytochrome P450 [Chloroflexi bacterium]|nr:cytochrome P450 [Chloroflexota bacterium]
MMFEFNPFAPEFKANPYPFYDMLRANAPLFHWQQWNMWFVTDYAVSTALLKDNCLGHELLSVMTREELGWTEPPASQMPLVEMQRGWMLFRDPPTHTRLRMLVHKAFTPRMVEQLRARIQSVTSSLLDAAEANGKLDVMADLAVPLPVMVIADMLGVPESDRELFRGWSRELAYTLELTDAQEIYEMGARATVSFSAYLRDLANERRKQPQADLMSALVAAEDAGDKLTEQELIATCILLLVAGHETTTNLIGNGLFALLRNPDQLAKLRDNPALGKTAIEELLRYDSPVQMTSRAALQDVEFNGQCIRKGTQVAFMLGAANHDPAQFEQPGTLDITRDPNPHLSFSNGIHYCLGAPLARLEGQIAIQSLLKRAPELTLLDENPTYRETWVLRGLESLPVRLG